jgi:hypothetical protein
MGTKFGIVARFASQLAFISRHSWRSLWVHGNGIKTCREGRASLETNDMIRDTVVVLALLGLAFAGSVVRPASAQDQSPPTSTAPPAPLPQPATPQPPAASTSVTPVNPAAPPGTPAQDPRERVRAARQECLQQAKDQGLRGAAARQQVESCFAAKMPEAAKRMECRREALSKGVDQTGMRAYIMQCLASKG